MTLYTDILMTDKHPEYFSHIYQVWLRIFMNLYIPCKVSYKMYLIKTQVFVIAWNIGEDADTDFGIREECTGKIKVVHIMSCQYVQINN